MKCSACGKELETTELDALDECADGLEGYIARERPVPAEVYCNDECFEKRRIH
jgi:hypothetical protein